MTTPREPLGVAAVRAPMVCNICGLDGAQKRFKHDGARGFNHVPWDGTIGQPSGCVQAATEIITALRAKVAEMEGLLNRERVFAHKMASDLAALYRLTMDPTPENMETVAMLDSILRDNAIDAAKAGEE